MPPTPTDKEQQEQVTGIRAYVQEEFGSLNVRIAIAQVNGHKDDSRAFLVPTHILHLYDDPSGGTSYSRGWRPISDPMAIQEPTFRLEDTEARALCEGLIKYFQPEPIIINVTADNGEKLGEAVMQQIRNAVRDARWRW